MKRYHATIEERGNGFADVGEYVTEAGELYEIVEIPSGRISTGQQGSGAPNTIRAIVEPADWSDVDDDSEPYCTAIVDTEHQIEED